MLAVGHSFEDHLTRHGGVAAVMAGMVCLLKRSWRQRHDVVLLLLTSAVAGYKDRNLL